MSNEIEQFDRNTNVLDLFLGPNSGPLPTVIEPREGDILNMTGHEHVHEATASLVFAQLDTVAATVIEAVPEVRAQFVRQSKVRLAEIGDNEFMRFDFSRSSDGDNVTYTVERSDIGSDGGFMFCQRGDGSFIIRHDDMECFYPGTEEFEIALKQIYSFVNMFARELHVPLGAMAQEAVTKSEQFKKRIGDMYREENSVLGRLKKRARFILNTVIDVAKLPITQKSYPEIEESKERKLSPARIAILGLLAPLPGFSSVYEPASVELGYRAYDFAFVNEPTPEETARAEFEASGYDVPGAETIANDGELRDIQVFPNVPDEVMEHSRSQNLTSFRDNEPISINSPTALHLSGELLKNECAEVALNEGVEDSIAVFTLNEGDANGLEVSVGGDRRVKICNASDNLLPIDSRIIFVDPRG